MGDAMDGTFRLCAHTQGLGAWLPGMSPTRPGSFEGSPLQPRCSVDGLPTCSGAKRGAVSVVVGPALGNVGIIPISNQLLSYQEWFGGRDPQSHTRQKATAHGATHPSACLTL